MDIFLSHEHILKSCHPKMGDTALQNVIYQQVNTSEQNLIFLKTVFRAVKP